LPLESVDESAGVARAAWPATYPLGRNAMQDRHTAWVENVLEVLDEPGEWVLDAETARLYLWPLGDRPGDDVLVPLLTELVRVEGRIDYDGPEDQPVENLAFRRIAFTHGDRFTWHGRTGWGIQHDWERFDSPSAMLRLRGAEGCTVEDCHFTHAGSTGQRHLAKQRPFGIETHSVAADPRFADTAKADFRFLPGSPALGLGIRQPISVHETGLPLP